ncbi:MAG: aspartate kinase [Firmicutes bacterium]|nr:aspartate kinase [Bacillota bacterium]
MKIAVQKFGGSSLASAGLRRGAKERVRQARKEGYSPVVVVSALGREGDPYATDTLIRLMQETNPQAELRNTDMLLSCGEIIAAAIFAEDLNSSGLPAVALTGWQAGVYTDDAHLGARVQSVYGEKIWEVLRAGKIPVVAGFQGVTEKGEVTTLGRGGSDTTAAVLAVFLQAEKIEVFTDVDGVKTADPKIVPGAPTLKTLSYREVMELAHMGAEVLHPRAAEIAMKEKIPVRILSLIHSQGGTSIGFDPQGDLQTGGEIIQDRVVTGVAQVGQRAQVKIGGSSDFHSSGAASQIFRLLAQEEISLDLIFLSSDLIAFVIEQSGIKRVQKVLTPLGLDVRIKVGFAKVSVVGAGMHGVPGVMARVVHCLEKEKVRIFQTTDSHANISCLVREEQVQQAVQALYREFNLDNI